MVGKVLRVSTFYMQTFTQTQFSVCYPCTPSIVTGIIPASKTPVLLSPKSKLLSNLQISWDPPFSSDTLYDKDTMRDFPGGAVVKNLPANARGHGFQPWSGKIPHAAEQLSLCTTTTEALVPRSCALQQEKPLQ